MNRKQAIEHLARKMYRIHRQSQGDDMTDDWSGVIAWNYDATEADRAYWRGMASETIGDHLSVIHRENLRFLVNAIEDAGIVLSPDERNALTQARNAIEE